MCLITTSGYRAYLDLIDADRPVPGLEVMKMPARQRLRRHFIIIFDLAIVGEFAPYVKLGSKEEDIGRSLYRFLKDLMLPAPPVYGQVDMAFGGG